MRLKRKQLDLSWNLTRLFDHKSHLEVPFHFFFQWEVSISDFVTSPERSASPSLNPAFPALPWHVGDGIFRYVQKLLTLCKPAWRWKDKDRQSVILLETLAERVRAGCLDVEVLKVWRRVRVASGQWNATWRTVQAEYRGGYWEHGGSY